MEAAQGSPGYRERGRGDGRRLWETRAGFTLLEVMVAIAVVAIALVALLGLHHQSLESVIRARDLTQAALLAQELMTQAELERFPPLGSTSGDFQANHPGQYPNFRWQRSVEPSAVFLDVRKVKVRVLYGPGLHRSFDVVEFLHSPGSPGQAQ